MAEWYGATDGLPRIEGPEQPDYRTALEKITKNEGESHTLEQHE